MTGISLSSAKALAEKFSWAPYCTVADVGAAEGAVPVQLALAHAHLKTIGYDLPVVQPVFTARRNTPPQMVCGGSREVPVR